MSFKQAVIETNPLRNPMPVFFAIFVFGFAFLAVITLGRMVGVW